MVSLVLRVLSLFGWLLKMLGVDNDQFRAIVETKVTLDERRPMRGVHSNTAKPVNRGLLYTALFYFFFGIMAGAAVIVVESPMTAMTMINSILMTMIGMVLVSDFTNVLVDTTDNAVLLPRPVSGRTILVARIVHIVSYLAILSLSLSAFTIIAGAVVIHPLFPLLFLGTLACTLGFVIFVVHLFYLLAMRLFDMERFRDIILYFQIAMTVLIFAGYQLLPRLIDVEKIIGITLDNEWWIYIFPPAWMAAPFDLLAGHAGRPQIILSCLAFFVPLAGMIVVIRVLAPGFNRSLAALESATPGGRITAPERKSPARGLLPRLLVHNREEQAAFDLFWPIISRDRPFKLATYPSIAIILIMTVSLLFLSDREGIGHAVSTISQTDTFLFILYISCAILPTAFVQMYFSDNCEASWIYSAMPVERPGVLLMAAFKVVLLRFAAPMFLLVVMVTLFFWGPAVWADILLAACVFLLYSLFCARLFGRRLPFSMPRGTSEAQGQGSRTLISMMFLAIAGGAHWLLRGVPFAVPIAILLSIPFILREYRKMAQTRWVDLGQGCFDGISVPRKVRGSL